MTTTRTRWERWASHAITGVLMVFAGMACFRPLFSKTPWMLFFEDDFFYYLKVAQNLAQGAGSTFNGIYATNGYHPLWFLLLAGMSAVSTRPQVILGFAGCVLFVCTLAIYFFTRHLLGVHGAGRVISSALAVYATAYCMRIMFGGMEIVLTLPLLLLVVALARSPTLFEHRWRGFAWLGLACSAMILSRLDTMLLGGLILISVLADTKLRRWFDRKLAGGLLVGLLPVMAYLGSNLLYFGTLLPVSGAAKQMKAGYLPSLPAWRSVFDRPTSQLVNFLPIVVAIVFVPMLRKRLAALDRAVMLPVLVFPFFYIAVLSCRSDWQLWGWYLYPFRAAFCVSLVVLAAAPVVERLLERRWVVIVVTLIALLRLPGLAWNVGGREEIYATALDLQAFARSHAGIYAMGDRSGMPGYLLPYPVIQTEGLVMDGKFLDSIRREEPLRDVLARYQVRYYVATSQTLPGRCFAAVEPAQAGPSSPHMRGEFCDPVAVYHHGEWYTLVFDLGA